MQEHLKKIILDSDSRGEFFLFNQIADPASPDRGALVRSFNMPQPKTTIYGLTTLLALYLTPGSAFFRSPRALAGVEAGLAYVERSQRPGGTFDLPDCNFASAPDTAFCVKRLLPVCRLLMQRGECPELLARIRRVMEKAAEGIAAGGFHTPNHRWAIASVLTVCSQLFDRPAFRGKAEEYLREGIDCAESGEYSERSAGNYNRINNDAMLLLYEETGDETYLETVRRNLKMMFCYFEPDGSIFTGNSTRYDSGLKVYPKDYYFEYLYMAWKTGDPEFAAAANRIMADQAARGERAPDCLALLLTHPALLDYEPQGCAYPQAYRRNFAGSGIVRVRDGAWSCSVLAGHPDFFRFQSGALRARVRIGMSFFEKRLFEASSITEKDGVYTLKADWKGWFYKPLAEKPATSDWWAMDQSKREIAPGPALSASVEIAQIEDGVSLRFHTRGCDRVPFKIVVSVDPGAFIRADGFLCEARPCAALAVKSGMLTIARGADGIEIGPAFASHFFVEGKEGGDRGSEALCSLYFTGYTSADRTITFRRLHGLFQ